MSINTILMIISVLVLMVILFIMYQRSKMKTADLIEEDFSTINHVLESVKMEMVELIKEDYSLGISDSEFNALYKRKARIQEALRNCVHGIDSAKVIVIELIRGYIAQNVPTEKVADLIGVGDGMQPSDHVMFEILLYKYKKEYGKQALSEIIEKYNLARERVAHGAETEFDTSYYITIQDLHDIYEKEMITLSPDEQIDILAIMVYQLYKGFGILDTLREMDINGFNCGTSGSIMSGTAAHREGSLKATNSVWLYYRGKYIHMRFMSFGSEDELKRIIQLLVRYNNPGPLTEKRGYLVNTMFDKSRILALRPSASEYWAVFVRKFTISDPSPRKLIAVNGVNRPDLPIRMLEYLMRGNVTAAVTGRQGSGKTTLMTSIIRYIDPRYTIRVLEMAPELYLREIYPGRNILSVQETQTVTSAELQDALKKSDAAVSIVGEVATDGIAARMIQMGMVASLFTIFSHHANTAKDLVYALRNSLVNAGGFSNMTTAERQVMEVVKVDVHLDYTPKGMRYIERITEIIPLEENIPYPQYDRNDPVNSMNLITKEFYERQTDRISFTTRDILRFNLETNTYEVADRLSPQLERVLRSNLGELVPEYDKFVIGEWGTRTDGSQDDSADSLVALYEGRDLSTLVETMDEDTSGGLALAVKPIVKAGFTLLDSPVEERNDLVQGLAIIESKKSWDDKEAKDKKDESDKPEMEDSIEDYEEMINMFDFFDGGGNV